MKMSPLLAGNVADMPAPQIAIFTPFLPQSYYKRMPFIEIRHLHHNSW
jgi:hypothetical protein